MKYDIFFRCICFSFVFLIEIKFQKGLGNFPNIWKNMLVKVFFKIKTKIVLMGIQEIPFTFDICTGYIYIIKERVAVRMFCSVPD